MALKYPVCLPFGSAAQRIPASDEGFSSERFNNMFYKSLSSFLFDCMEDSLE